jgi:hypothetical protein
MAKQLYERWKARSALVFAATTSQAASLLSQILHRPALFLGLVQELILKALLKADHLVHMARKKVPHFV